MDSLAAQVSQFESSLADLLPGEVLAPFVNERAALDAAGLPDGVAASGTPVPDGELVSVFGRPTSLGQARGGRPAVVVFYRGVWCPYCNLTLRAYELQLVPELDARGVALIAISPQLPDGSLLMQKSNELSYTVLSDPGNQIAGALGILTVASDEAQVAQADLGIDVAARNADGTPTVPMPTVVVVDAGGVIRWIDVHPDYGTRTEPAEILKALDGARPVDQ